MKTEWQVWLNSTPDFRGECHIFYSSFDAEAFAATLPDPVCHEGGAWSPRAIVINKVCRHDRAQIVRRQPG